MRRVADNARAHIVLTRSYSPFGKVLGEAGDVPTGFGFTGEQAEPGGLIFLRARYYDVGTGRFISKDPFPGYAASPQTQHAYAYATNNPVNLVDPSGEMPHLVVTTLAGALLDRFTHRCHILEFKGESYRFRQSLHQQTKVSTLAIQSTSEPSA